MGKMPMLDQWLRAEFTVGGRWTGFSAGLKGEDGVFAAFKFIDLFCKQIWLNLL